ncbi:hypothetical protein M670_00813 [Schinkia azotoformans MEV2011]|uniref:Uncharacterized protein n=1 Tax=Schinkia azotoformans MEV2011 TaxID=1348973 RepID=A0A072NQN0_SCHAZ|nr:hypothetical protein [Schinkia azotoformans]KEF39791.1 hypothetical protein M670_00813 [Schinkia azotoformans MEV2011]MEC1698025.1 hypothetical protein [Schinkia azotoformans]MEC1727606.1 hypothetical protein [Schinkia azotoformans]MEC1782090.1 hypothetical protein [Schinkia azotoformans]MED4331673.1 hypothetical protein [Schinkia azotoformans]
MDPREPSNKLKQRPFQKLGNGRYMRSPDIVSDLNKFNLTAKYLAKFGALSFVTGTVYDFATSEDRSLITLRNAATNNFFITGAAVGIGLAFSTGILGGILIGAGIGIVYGIVKETTGFQFSDIWRD